MQHMRIKTGEHEGVPQYSTVPVIDYLTIRTKSEMEEKLEAGYVVIEFEFPLEQVQRMTSSMFPLFMAKLGRS